ncbi:hypothetical protein [Microcoleus sp. herbarium14]|uniref:hypothetical protein n=1 Tax=Microcoleus sp. herbarium14 TaxID=3055439 RepID=UPI002FD2146E
MTTNNGKFTPEPKKTGDRIQSADWNAAMQEIARLETSKINREGAESLQGSLTIAEALTVSAILPLTSTPLEIKGALKLTEGVAVNQFSADDSLSNNSDSIVSTQKAIKSYVDTAVTKLDTTIKTHVQTTVTTLDTATKNYVNSAVQGSETQDFKAKDLRIFGNLTVVGSVTSKSTDKMEGNVELGNDDGDQITVFGRLKTGHSSGSLQVQTALQVTENLIVDGRIGLGTPSPTDKLHIQNGDFRIDNGQIKSLGTLTFRSDIDKSGDATLVNFIDKDSRNVLCINHDGNVGIGTTNPGATLEVNGSIRAKNIESSNPLIHEMYPSEPIVYQDIFAARDAGAIAKLGNPTYNEASYPITNLWNDRPIIMYGGNNETDGNGAVVTIPEGYNTVWVRVLGDRWNAIKAYLLDKDNKKTEELGVWTGGYRSTNCYCPDGSLSDSYFNFHQWLPIAIGTNLASLPAGETRKVALISKLHTDKDLWFSGLAFSKNPWNHAAQSAVGYHWALNGGNQITWNSNNWNNDVLGVIPQKTNLELKVPVVPSGRDKLLYIVEHNNQWNGCMHSGITVNGNPIQRFRATYDNPFARHWNSKFYERYIAARIPANMIPKTSNLTTYLSVRIDMSKQNNHIHVREIGTHDLEIPWNY